jgi:hypothetical protein
MAQDFLCGSDRIVVAHEVLQLVDLLRLGQRVGP